LPLAAVPMYFLLECFKNGDGKMAWYKMVISGFCAGCIFLIKYTILSFALTFVLFVIVEFLRRKNYSGLWKAALLYLGGAVISFFPWIIYFGANGAFEDFYTVYIYNNIFLYGKKETSGNVIRTLIDSVKDLRDYFRTMYSSNAFMTISCVIAFLWAALGGVFKIKAFSMDRVFIPISCVTVFVFICIGMNVFTYYYIPMGAFVVFGFIGVYSMAEYIVRYLCGIIREKKGSSSSVAECECAEEGDVDIAAGDGAKRVRLDERFKRVLIAFGACLAAIGASIGLCFGCSMNISYMGVDKNELFMFQFASIIKEKGGKTMLNYGYLDFGVYTVTDILPTCKYFCGLNIALSEIYETQNEFVVEGKVDFIVTEEAHPSNIDLHYTLVATGYRKYDAAEGAMYLFEKTH